MRYFFSLFFLNYFFLALSEFYLQKHQHNFKYFSVCFKHDCFHCKCINHLAGLFTSWLWDVLGVQWSSCHHPMEPVMEKMGKGLQGWRVCPSLFKVHLGTGAGLGGLPGEREDSGRTPSCCISVPAFLLLPPGSSSGSFPCWWWPWGQDSDTSHLATGGGWLVGPGQPRQPLPQQAAKWG